MKFTLFTQAAMAIPLITGAFATPTPDTSEVKRADCSMTVRYRTDCVEKGLERYRMQLITSPRNDRHLGVYCDAFKVPAGFVINPQCFWGDAYLVDVSAARGPAGRRAVRDVPSKACKDFEVYTGCRTIREF
ncbi:hypothetical protein J7337_013214 [Fusarium musae]|uniref:Uncharacterized protein n=1 Tax=Fusarium musae TaxID=1042133 RepID=A0A9P8D445_9HYPO|nr:hypothetical protein J7337_013214 [Fusarium musae]KAG9494985.1 hypothetical protein J7337_013214 [Fusarium musae]